MTLCGRFRSNVPRRHDAKLSFGNEGFRRQPAVQTGHATTGIGLADLLYSLVGIVRFANVQLGDFTIAARPDVVPLTPRWCPTMSGRALTLMLHRESWLRVTRPGRPASVHPRLCTPVAARPDRLTANVQSGRASFAPARMVALACPRFCSYELVTVPVGSSHRGPMKARVNIVFLRFGKASALRLRASVQCSARGERDEHAVADIRIDRCSCVARL
jgi:hypothetical protein